MNTTPSLRSTIEQVTNNTTGWVGQDPQQHTVMGKGQTFVAVNDADVDSIAVYANIISQPGNVLMTVHQYDPLEKAWGPAIGSASLRLTQHDTEKWVAFKLPTVHLNKGRSYGFKLESNDSFIGVGEAAGSAKQPPFISGQEWQFSDREQNGNAYSYFSLAFKVGMRA
ncbi:MAG: hypothetical protein ABIO04_08265 [Ferruginibacter sp.]